MKSGVLRKSQRFLVPLMLALSAALLIRGHDAPGGGFSGGLLAATAFALRFVALNPHPEEHSPSLPARYALAIGLLALILGAVWPMLAGKPVLASVDTEIVIPPNAHLGSSLLFECGIYLVSCGAGVLILQSALKRP